MVWRRSDHGFPPQTQIQTEMSIQIIQLGSPRRKGEGLRIGTVRRPPRGVKKSDYSKLDWFDVWFPNLAPSVETMRLGKDVSTKSQWQKFEERYRREMNAAPIQHELKLLAALSHHTNFSVGCYCKDESRCHRSILRILLLEANTQI